MGKFRCVCGEVISTSGEIPNPNEWRGMSDVDRRTVVLYRCPKSDHIWAFWDGFDHAPRLYAPAPLPDGW